MYLYVPIYTYLYVAHITRNRLTLQHLAEVHETPPAKPHAQIVSTYLPCIIAQYIQYSTAKRPTQYIQYKLPGSLDIHTQAFQAPSLPGRASEPSAPTRTYCKSHACSNPAKAAVLYCTHFTPARETWVPFRPGFALDAHRERVVRSACGE